MFPLHLSCDSVSSASSVEILLRLYLLVVRWKVATMSESDDILSSVDSNTSNKSSGEESESETPDEMEVVGHIQNVRRRATCPYKR